MYTKECIETFLKNQSQLFDEPVAETYEEAEEFLEDCMAVVVDSLKEARSILRKAERMWKEWRKQTLKKQARYLLFLEAAI